MLETSLINTNFCLLFVLTLYYWLSALNFIPMQLAFLGPAGVMLSQLFQGCFLLFRWINSGHFPLSNLYESVLFLSWILTVLLTFLHQSSFSQQLKKTNNLVSEKFNSIFIGSIMTPIILLINTFALFSLPNELKVTTALVPALQSNWLVMHVTVMILSYAMLIAGCLFSMAYLVVTSFNPMYKPLFSQGASLNQTNLTLISNDSLSNTNATKTPTELSKQTSFSNFKQSNSFNQLAYLLDNLSYRVLGLGFPLLTIGLLSGSIWANQTWGSYWSWDPKETWALITWFIFAIYLHTRFSKGWSGRKSAFLATFGFFVLWICYLGVNLMGKGLHSYGFLT